MMVGKVVFLYLALLTASLCSGAFVLKPRAKRRQQINLNSRYQRLVTKVFDEADTDHSGWISLGECYELVLKLYVNINRQAPIPPPSRQKVKQMFSLSDANHNHRISRYEFNRFAHLLGRRALIRVVTHKIVTLLCAPLLAEYIVRQLTGKEWLKDLAQLVVPERYKEKVLPILTSAAFCRTVLIVIFVATLGNTLIGSVNWFLDLYLTPGEK